MMKNMTRGSIATVVPMLFVLTSAAAGYAQTATPNDQPRSGELRFSEPIVIPAADSQAVLATLKPTDRNIDKVVRTVATNGSAGHISIAAVRYHAGPEQWNGTANMHNKITEVFYVTKGSATFSFGGQLEDPKAFPANSDGVKNIAGPGHNGKVKNNKRVTAKPGDTIVLPPNTPHEILKVDDEFEMVVIRIDPEGLVSLK